MMQLMKQKWKKDGFTELLEGTVCDYRSVQSKPGIPEGKSEDREQCSVYEI